MINIITILLWFVFGCGLFILGCFYIIIRNNWVFYVRIDALHTDPEGIYRNLMSYDRMLYRYFYVWNREWFYSRAKEAKP